MLARLSVVSIFTVLAWSLKRSVFWLVPVPVPLHPISAAVPASKFAVCVDWIAAVL